MKRYARLMTVKERAERILEGAREQANFKQVVCALMTGDEATARRLARAAASLEFRHRKRSLLRRQKQARRSR